jgi:hypothetical protein
MDVLQNHSRFVVTKRQYLPLQVVEHRMAGRTVRSLVTILSHSTQEQFVHAAIHSLLFCSLHVYKVDKMDL